MKKVGLVDIYPVRQPQVLATGCSVHTHVRARVWHARLSSSQDIAPSDSVCVRRTAAVSGLGNILGSAAGSWWYSEPVG